MRPAESVDEKQVWSCHQFEYDQASGSRVHAPKRPNLSNTPKPSPTSVLVGIVNRARVPLDVSKNVVSGSCRLSLLW